jgi:hypothetical protein
MADQLILKRASASRLFGGRMRSVDGPLTHGFTIEQLVELVRAGLATATPQRVKAGNFASQTEVHQGRGGLVSAPPGLFSCGSTKKGR